MTFFVIGPSSPSLQFSYPTSDLSDGDYVLSIVAVANGTLALSPASNIRFQVAPLIRTLSHCHCWFSISMLL